MNQLVSNELMQKNPDVLKSFLESLVAAAAARSTATVGTPAAEPLSAEKPQLAEVSDADKTTSATKRAAEEMIQPEGSQKVEHPPPAYKAFWSKFKRPALHAQQTPPAETPAVEPTTEATKGVKPTEAAPAPNGSMVSSTTAAAADTAVPTEKPYTAEPAEPAPVEEKNMVSTTVPATEAAKEVKPAEPAPNGSMVSSTAAATAVPTEEPYTAEPAEPAPVEDKNMVSTTVPATEAAKEVKPAEPAPAPNGSMVSSTAAAVADTAVPTEKPNTAEPAEPAAVEDKDMMPKMESTNVEEAPTQLVPAESAAMEAADFEKELEAMLNAPDTKEPVGPRQTKQHIFRPEQNDVAAALMRKTTVDLELAERKQHHQQLHAPPAAPAVPVAPRAMENTPPVTMPGHKKIRMLVGDELMDVWVPLKNNEVMPPSPVPAVGPTTPEMPPPPAPAVVPRHPEMPPPSAPAVVPRNPEMPPPPAPAVVRTTDEMQPPSTPTTPSDDASAHNGEKALRNTYMRFLRSINSILFAIKFWYIFR